MNIEEIRMEVRAACARPENLFTPAFYDQHLAPVAGYGAALAAALGADPEAVELAAWTHDLAAILDFGTLARHAEVGADVAGALLARHGCPEQRIVLIADAITRHSTPLAPGQGTPEAVCLSQADAMAQIARPPYWLFYAFKVRDMGYPGGRNWYAERVRSNWEALIPEARELVRWEYEQAVRLLA